MSSIKAALLGAATFGGGGLIAAAANVILFLGSDSRAGPPAFLFPLSLLGTFPGGAIGWGAFVVLSGGRARDAIPGAAGFGVGFVLSFFIVMFVHISLQGGGQPEYGYAAVGCGVGYGIAGAIGGAFSGRALFLRAMAAFGIAGAIGGPLSFFMIYHGVAPLFDFGMILLPYALGGAILGSSLTE